MCDPLDKNNTVKTSQLEHGDIVCFQRERPEPGAPRALRPTVPQFMTYVKDRQARRPPPSRRPRRPRRAARARQRRRERQ